MKKSLYDVLQVSKLADRDIIEAAYQRLLQKFQADGSPESQNQIKFIQHAYETLSNPDKKTLYDQKLQDQENPPQYQNGIADTFNVWWKSPKVTWIIIATIALVGFSLFTGHIGVKNKVEIVKESETTKRQANELNATNTSKHLDNEGALVKGVVENQSKYIEESANVANRVVDVAREAEDNRANARAQQLEMQRREQEARLEMQRKQQADSAQRMEEQRAERERHHYECLNNAMAKYGAQRAASMCPR